MATNTYVALDKITVGTAVSSVTFSSIPATYTDLVIVASFTVATASANLVMTFNGDTTSGLYSKTQLEGTGTSVFSGRTANGNNIGLDSNIGNDTTSPSIQIIQLMNYANTSVFKTVLARQGGYWSANPGVSARVGLWRNTNAITSVTLTNGAVNFSVGSTFSLYGIASAEVGAKATGGVISSDASYWYHTFLANGTFTPTQSLSCDYLIVAGGGGGGTRGGGGAGGFRTATAQSLTTTAYTVTVGAGGAINANGADSVFNSITSTGGGKGATSTNAGNGGSGGGGYDDSGTNWLLGTGNTPSTSPSQGNNGGAGGGATRYTGGGGGGAGAAGGAGQSGSGTLSGGTGGAGTASSISGSSVTYAGGGGGGGDTGGAGGTGGGGTGATSATDTATAGGTNLGGGGGGGRSGAGVAKAGGSGIVIVRYAK
jgi:hypothetical protein